jgi:hypothetical protein
MLGGTVKVLQPAIKKNDEHVLKEIFTFCLAEIVEFA